MTNGVVNRQPIRDVASRTIDVHRDRLRTVVCQFAQPFDDDSRAVLLDIADEVDVPEPLGLLFSNDALDRVQQFADEAIADWLAHMQLTLFAFIVPVDSGIPATATTRPVRFDGQIFRRLV